MNEQKIKMHFAHSYLLTPTNPVTVNIIGIGGTGTHMLSALARMNHSLIALGHPGLFVRAFDDDTVSPANVGRQLFSQSETGLHKAVALITRLNRFYGTNWKAVPFRYGQPLEQPLHAHITVSCVDTVQARFEIAAMLRKAATETGEHDRPLYWMDAGNSRYTGQVVLATAGNISQPRSQKYEPVENLPFVTDEYKELLETAEQANDTPSCSVAESLDKQDLFINPTLANAGTSLLWQLFREGMIQNRGFFMNLKDFRVQPIVVG